MIASGWEFRKKGWEKENAKTPPPWMPAQVPGSVHLDLIANDVIPDPHEKRYEIGAQWIDKEAWAYRTTFDWTPQPNTTRRVLRFDGLDTISDVYLNDALIAHHENMFVPLEIDVTDKLIEGENALRVEFASSVLVGEARKAEYFAREGLSNDILWFDERAFVRKAQFMYGWDWGPRLVSCGIHLPVALLEFTSRITDVWVHQTRREDGSVLIKIGSTFEGEGRIVHELIGDDIGAITLEGDGEIVLEDPNVWSPTEPNLYEVTTTLISAENADHELDFRSQQIGVVEIRLLREPDKYGESFEFEVNGEKVWTMGANWIPDHSFSALVDRDRLWDRLSQAKALGMNMLRVWGGGFYESDAFYEICSTLGIMVWQDFPFACNYYPDDEPWQEIIRAEAIVNVKRLRNYACLALWCGNNENLEMFKNQWGGPTATPPRYYGENHYDKVLPEVVAEFDPGRSYIPTSPIGTPPDEKVADAKRRGPNADGYGDQHNWDVWHGRGDWRYYSDSKGRFSSEYGFASSCSLYTWRKAAKIDGSADPRSLEVVWHDKTGKGTETFIGYVELHYPSSKTLEDWVYYSQLNQRDALRHGIEHYRRSEFCRGSLVWQLNDCWPVQSWAMIDSEGRFKALAYDAPRLHRDVVVFLERDEDVVHLWALNDSPESAEFDVTIEARSLATGQLLRTSERISEVLGPDERARIGSLSIKGLATPDTIVSAFDSWRLLAEPKEARFAPPCPILASSADTEDWINIRLDSPVVDLMLTVDGDPAPFVDNFITVLEPGVVRLQVNGPIRKFEARSLAGKHEVVMTRSPIL